MGESLLGFLGKFFLFLRRCWMVIVLFECDVGNFEFEIKLIEDVRFDMGRISDVDDTM